jgi:hypothetical protein
MPANACTVQALPRDLVDVEERLRMTLGSLAK